MSLKHFLILAACFFAGLPVSRADNHPDLLRAIATTDSTEVHPDSVFEVTLSLENLTDATQAIKIPACGWDRFWRSSNRRVTWDAWECDSNDEITIEIPPHKAYVFQQPLKMFVESAARKSRIEFRMGFKTRTFGGTLWSAPLSLEVTP